jgi:hypothetical protein
MLVTPELNARNRREALITAGLVALAAAWLGRLVRQEHRQDAQKILPSHPPSPGAPRRADPQARPQQAKRRGIL